MEEKVLSKKKNGMAALFCIMVLYAVSVAGILFGMRNAYIEFIIGGIFVAGAATILIAGLKVLKPQEALVLTLFGKYVGTLKEELKALDEAYKREVDDFVAMEKANEQAYAIVTEAVKKIASIKSGSGASVSETDNSKAMEQHKVPENLKGRMLSAADIFKQNYAAFNPDTDSLSQILSRVKIS